MEINSLSPISGTPMTIPKLSTIAKVGTIVGFTAVVGAGVATVGLSYLNKQKFNNVLSGNLYFPNDLETLGIGIAFDFMQYQRRSIFNQPFLNQVGRIRLPIPKNLEDKYHAQWPEAESSSMVGATMEAGLNAAQNPALGGAAGALGVVEGLVQGAGISAGSALLAKAQGSSSVLNGLSLEQMLQPLGLAVNPFLTVLFKRPDFKRFQFNWRLIATNPQEAQTIQSIVTKIKYHMHPSVNDGNGGVLMQYPDMVQPRIFTDDSYLIKFKPCVVETLDVNYTPQGPAFRNGGQSGLNVPTIVDITMSLLEIEYWTKESVIAAYGDQTASNFAAGLAPL